MLPSLPHRSAAPSDAATARGRDPAASVFRLAIATLLAACAGGADTPSPVEPPGNGSGGAASATVSVVQMPRAADTVDVGATRTLTVTLRDVRGGTLTGRGVVWVSSDTSVARVDTAGMPAGSAELRGVGPGSATLTATSEGKQAWLRVLVQGATVRRIRIDTAARVIGVGDSLLVAAVALDSVGQPLPDRAIAFAAASGNTGTVAMTQLAAPGGATLRVRALTAGTAAIVASSGTGVRAVVPITVLNRGAGPTAPFDGSLSFGPRRIALGVGRSIDLPVTATSAAGDTVAPVGVTYTVADPGVADVDAAGRVTMLAPGTTTLTATLQGRTASLALASLSAAPVRSFRIDLRFLGSPDPSLALAARTAATRWESVIAASPGAFPVTLAAGECHSGTPAMNETVANLVIFVRLDTIDGPGGAAGNLIGSAGPCVVREAGGVFGSPVVGVVNLDAYDLLHPTGGGSTIDVISHQIGHVLGIGTTWNIPGQREFVPGLSTGRYDYVAPHAVRAAYELGFAASAAAPVPVEDQGGGGTLGSHWRERVFGSELMTGYIDFAPDPISQITIGTLADLGWTVDPAGAEPYSVLTSRSATRPSAARGFSASRAIATSAHLAHATDRPLRPRLAVARSGTMTRLPQ